MTKSLTSKLNLNKRSYSHSMVEGTSLEEHLTTFKEIVADLETLEVKYEEEDLGLMFSLPNSCAVYSRDTLYQFYRLNMKLIYINFI